MIYAFPEDLAAQVIERWETFVARHDRHAPPLPCESDLRHILATAFFASLEREEGRNLRFVLCCAPGLEVLRDGFGELVPAVPISPPRPISVDAIRALAPAVSPDNAAILVRCPAIGSAAGPCEIAGVLQVGSNLARARTGRSFYYRPAPYALMIDVRDAGEIHVYQGGVKVAALKAGRLHDQIAYSALEFLPIADILSRGEDALRPRIVAPDHEPARETSDFEWTALLNTILCIVNGARAHGHGGTVIIVAPGAERSLPIRAKFTVDEERSVLADRFVEFLNTRHVLMEARLHRRRVGEATVPDAALSHLQIAAFASEESLADTADVVAGLTAIDGALVLTSDLRVPGFGAEIVLDAAQPVTAYEVSHLSPLGTTLPAVDSEGFGMRHRSALRCVGVAHAAAAFVISQDGRTTFFWKQDGRVLLKSNVNTANPNMI
jgi:hypothetical protein